MSDVSDLAGRASREVKESEVVGLASDLVRIPSVTGYETAAARYLEAWFKTRGYDVAMQECEPGRYQAIAWLRGSGGGKSLMLNGHVDTNPVTYGTTRSPFEPQLEGGVLYGHGLGNMKAGVAAMIMAADTVRRMGVQLKGDVVICPVLGELQGGIGTTHLLEKGVRADMAIDPEPYGEHNIVTRHGGMITIAVNSRTNPNAPRELRYKADALGGMRRIMDALDGIRLTHKPSRTAPNNPMLRVGTILGGRGADYDPSCPYMPVDYCTAVLDVRTVPGMTPEGVMDDVRRAIDALGDPNIAYDLEHPVDAKLRPFTVDFPPAEGSTDAEIVKTVTRCYRSVTGKAPGAVGFTEGASVWSNDDAHLWAAGIPTVLYGPSGQFPGGGVPVANMMLVARVIAAAIVEVCA